MEERENEMKQKKTGISAEKQEQWILQGKYVILAVLVGICVGIVDTIFGRGLLAISAFRGQYYRYLLPILPVAGRWKCRTGRSGSTDRSDAFP